MMKKTLWMSLAQKYTIWVVMDWSGYRSAYEQNYWTFFPAKWHKNTKISYGGVFGN